MFVASSLISVIKSMEFWWRVKRTDVTRSRKQTGRFRPHILVFKGVQGPHCAIVQQRTKD
jgi:hypothetical protein